MSQKRKQLKAKQNLITGAHGTTYGVNIQHTPAECQLKKKVDAEKVAQKNDTTHAATDEEQDTNQEQQAIPEEEQDVFKMLATILEPKG